MVEENKEKLNNELIKFIKNMSIKKRLNFLIGSGASMPAMPLMGEFKNEETGEIDYKGLIDGIIKKSKLIINDKELVASDEEEKNKINKVTENYKNFMQSIIDILNLSNSRQTPKNVNIFTTNYDLFIEKATDDLLKNNSFIFNDGANGYFFRTLSSSNYNKITAYKGLNDNYLNEIPSISLIKPHGSVNWEKKGEEINVLKEVSSNPFVVAPTGHENRDTFSDNHFFNMLRTFQLELDKPQTLLIVIGFSFQDKHITDMVKRSLENPEFVIIIFCYSKKDKDLISNNLRISSERRNIIYVKPNDLAKESLTINEVSNLLKIDYESETIN